VTRNSKTEAKQFIVPVFQRDYSWETKQCQQLWKDIVQAAEPSHLPVDLLRPYPVEKMKAWKMGNDVGNVRNNRPELIEPI
jgi:putative SOS response-associated peptidase YedK